MCDYSLEHVKSRPAKVGEKLTTRDFGWATRGFAAPEDALPLQANALRTHFTSLAKDSSVPGNTQTATLSG
jgi:hypothetical protein